jgi:hypothetical protein|tara:strand:+ start:215 stop:877 length:663 start_codon:yes stop_codon:yes gene_type:complete
MKTTNEHLIYNSFLKDVGSDRLKKIISRYELFKYTLDIKGDICECGVFKGSGFFTWVKLMKIFKPNSDSKVIGFDFFETNRSINFKFKKDKEVFNDHKDNFISQKELKNKCLNWGFKNIALHAGNIADTSKVYMTQNIGGRISLLYLDVDNYEGTMAVLKNLYPILTKGGVVAFDNYYNHNHGEHVAVDEFFKDKKVNIKSFPWDNSSMAYFIKNNEQKS